MSGQRDLASGLVVEAAVISDRLRENGFDPAHAVNRQVLGLAEEVGEFVGAYRRWSGQARRTGTEEEMHEELADVIITAFVTAHELGVDIQTVIAAKLDTVHTRGWREPDTIALPADWLTQIDDCFRVYSERDPSPRAQVSALLTSWCSNRTGTLTTLPNEWRAQLDAAFAEDDWSCACFDHVATVIEAWQGKQPWTEPGDRDEGSDDGGDMR